MAKPLVQSVTSTRTHPMDGPVQLVPVTHWQTKLGQPWLPNVQVSYDAIRAYLKGMNDKVSENRVHVISLLLHFF